MKHERTITVKKADIHAGDAEVLLRELSDTLQSITGNSGNDSFAISDMDDIRSVFVMAYDTNGTPVGCGCIRAIDEQTAELKRMYAKTPNIGVGTEILRDLEMKASQLGYTRIILETRKINEAAVRFYKNNGYTTIENYGKYRGIKEAVCFQKQLLVDFF